MQVFGMLKNIIFKSQECMNPCSGDIVDPQIEIENVMKDVTF